MTLFEILTNAEYIVGWAVQVIAAVLYMGLYIGYRGHEGNPEQIKITRSIILLNIILMLILSGMPLLLMGGFHIAKRVLELVLLGTIVAICKNIVQYLKVTRDK